MRARYAALAGGILGCLAIFLVAAPRTSYSPGPLSKGHAPISAQCAACHRPWQPVSNQGCIDCHGDYAGHNPHGGTKVHDSKDGLVTGVALVSFKDKLECLSCHSDHRGRMVNVAATASTSCIDCHHHPNIGDVSSHTRSQLQRPTGSRHLFKKAFSHAAHLELLQKRDPSLTALNCVSCHVVENPSSRREATFSFPWSSCSGSGCHVSPSDEFLDLTVPAGSELQNIDYSSHVTIRLLNTVFFHSPGHLRSACADCHLKIQTSKRDGDPASRVVAQCFGCHAHQETAPAKPGRSARASSHILQAVAEAAEPTASKPLSADEPSIADVENPSPSPAAAVEETPPAATPAASKTAEAAPSSAASASKAATSSPSASPSAAPSSAAVSSATAAASSSPSASASASLTPAPLGSPGAVTSPSSSPQVSAATLLPSPSPAGSASPGALPHLASPSPSSVPLQRTGVTRQERQVTQCWQCHEFHVHGAAPDHDLLLHPPEQPPHLAAGMTVAAYSLHFTGKSGRPSINLRKTSLSPWWLGWAAFAVVGLAGFGLTRVVPSIAGDHKVISGVAPQRTPEVPHLTDVYESSIRGLFIVGETAGTASINLAMRSGRQVVQAISSALRHKQRGLAEEIHEVAIVGSGPAGIAAIATAKAAGLRYVALEKLTAASTIRAYPRGKFVQATPIDIAEYGSFYLEGDNTKEELIKEWEKIVREANLTINEREEVVNVVRKAELFELTTASGNTYSSVYVVLAMGVRGTPRRLGVAGEAPERVFYNLIEPEEFQNKQILVIGGGNAGAEVTQALANPGLHNTVSYSFRDPALKNVTRENAEKVSKLQTDGRITVYPLTCLKEIKAGKIVLEPIPAGASSGMVEIDNDAIFAMLGAELPTKFLKAIGVRTERKGR